MHDAFFGRPGLQPVASVPGLADPVSAFLPVPAGAPPATDATEGPAVSAAARRVLLELYPDFDAVIEAAWSSLKFSTAVGEPDHAASDFGERVAQAVIADRAADGSADPGAVPEIDRFWRHREDPTDLGQGFLGQKWGSVRLFSAPSIPEIADHPVPRSAAYNRAHDQVRARGNQLPETGLPGNVAPRTPLQSLIGLYWAYDGASQIGTPPRLYNQVVRRYLERYKGFAGRAASARLLALVNVAMADAGIAAWHYKYKYQLWRPILGIREYDDSFWLGKDGKMSSHGLHRRCDPWWTPLGAPRTNEPGRRSFTPPFPAYPSGHATFGAAAFEMVRLFHGVRKDEEDHIAFDFVSDEMDGRAIAEDGSFRSLHRRHHVSLLQAMFDNAVSRVYLGVHWRFDGLGETVKVPKDILTDSSKMGGVPLGRTLAQTIYARKMARNPNPKGAEIVLADLKMEPESNA